MKNPPANTGDTSSIPGVDPKEQEMAGRPPGEAMATHSSIPAWVIPWTEVASCLQSMDMTCDQKSWT